MIGRRVSAGGEAGVVLRWEPLSAGLCDALVRHDDGREVWHGSSSLRPVDGLGSLPLRHEAQESARRIALRQLREIRAQLVREFHRPWPGAEHGKALVGMGIDGAIEELEKEKW